MSSRPHITIEDFASTFPRLIEGRYLLPKKRLELQMLLVSAVSGLERNTIYSEPEINASLHDWIERFGSDLTVDHVTLRRYLVDESVLCRDPSGSSYSLCDESPYFTFEASIWDIDLVGLVSRARGERAARKRAYLAASTQK